MFKRREFKVLHGDGEESSSSDDSDADDLSQGTLGVPPSALVVLSRRRCVRRRVTERSDGDGAEDEPDVLVGRRGLSGRGVGA